MAGRSMCILNMKKLRCREIEWFVQGCPVSDGQSKALTQVSDLKVSAACTAKRRGKARGKGAGGVQGSILPRSWMALLLGSLEEREAQ